ncbi:MAG TPA: FkbM family methyltransferase [Chitinophagaceae bacterium]
MNNILIRFLNRAKLLPLLNLNSTIQVMGKGVDIPIRKSLGYSHLHAFEPWMTQLMKKLQPLFPGHFVDIGVNLGQTLIKAKSVFGDFEYTGFEPNPYCVAYVEELIKANKWKNCNVIPVGIADKTEVLKLNFYYEATVDPSASIVPDFRANQKVDHFIYIPVMNEAQLSEFLPSVKNCLTKIDVEGAELEVLRGLKNWISSSRPLVIIEILPVYSADNEFRVNRQQQLESFLRDLNYTILRIGKGKLDLTHLDSIEIHGDIDKCDYVLCPAEMKETVLNQVNRH